MFMYSERRASHVVRRHGRRASQLLVVSVLVLGTIGGAEASAGQETMYDGTSTGDQVVLGSSKNLTSVSGTVYNAFPGHAVACVNALESNGELAGSYWCTPVGATGSQGVTHPYCGCKPRRGRVTVSSSSDTTWFTAWQNW